MRKSMHQAGSTVEKAKHCDHKRDVEESYSLEKEKPELIKLLDKLDGKLAAYRQQKGLRPK